MQELTICLTSNEEIEVENKLRELYVLQDKPIKKDQFQIMVNEIVNSGKPFGAIMAGLNDLKTADLKKVSYPVIMGAIFDHCDKVEKRITHCDECSTSGFIVMKDAEGMNFSLACHCPSGGRARKDGLIKWDGSSIQFSNGRQLTRS